MARYYIIAGESSGDMHGANLMKSLQQHDPNAVFRFWGGDRMSALAGKPVKHIRELAFMGFMEVVLNLRTIVHNLRLCKDDIIRFKPDVLILIDYPGFNLRIAEFAHRKGFKVVYYISPQIWAWKQNRIRKIKKSVDKMLVILPFEKDFYAGLGMKVEFPGHPLLDEVLPIRKSADYSEFIRKNQLPEKPVVALLPGSRKQEVSRMLNDMMDVAVHFPDYQFVVAGLSGLGKDFYQHFSHSANISVVFDQTYSLLANSKAALVASGTATLETALFNVPQVVCYRANPVSYAIARRLVKVNYISLVNLIMDRPVLKELIQKGFNKEILKDELTRLLFDLAYRSSMQSAYLELENKLGGQGASDKAAKIIIGMIKMA
jgi:lipid-A-disaccharide synthase